MNKTAIMLCLALCTANSWAQQGQDNTVTRAVMMGGGAANTYDTYLSPLEYRGWQVSLLRESMRMTHWPRIATQGLLGLSVQSTHNRADNANELGGLASYRQTWFYRWTPGSHWKLYAGGGAGGNMGFLYNTRGQSNNPAQAQLDASLHAAAAATYTWRWMEVRAQAEAPLAGLMFAPGYGQSYYEIFTMEQEESNVVFTHPGNCPTLRTLLTIDFRLPRIMARNRDKGSLGTVRVGYGADMLQGTPNNLRRHTYLHTAYIGFVRHFKLIR